MTHRTHVIYTGRVQGVFFRATAKKFARGFAVSGFVRNLADGTVELEVQGKADQVQGLLDAIAQRYTAHICTILETPRELSESEWGFRIEH